MKIKVRAKLDKIEKLGDLEYNKDCEYCMKNPFTLDAIETKKKLESDKDEVKDYLTKLDSVFSIKFKKEFHHPSHLMVHFHHLEVNFFQRCFLVCFLFDYFYCLVF